MQPTISNNYNSTLMNSRDYMQFRTDVHYDLSRLFDMANEHELEILQNMDLITIENQLLQNKIVTLEASVEDLLTRFQNIQTSDKRMKISYRDPKATIATYNQLQMTGDIDYTFGQITIPSAVRNRLYATSISGENYLPGDTKITLFEDTSPLYGTESVTPILMDNTIAAMPKISDENLYKALLPDKDSYWMHSSYQALGTNAIYGGIHIKVPYSIINSLFANSLILQPCPEYSITLLDVQYKDPNGNWKRLSTYTLTDGNPKQYQSLSKMRFIFEKAEMTELFIYFKQTVKVSTSTADIFNYGMYKVSLDYHEYSTSTTTILTKFQLNGQTFQSVDVPIPHSADGTIGDITSSCTHRLFYADNLEPQAFGVITTSGIDHIVIETVLNLINDTTPAPNYLEINYRVN